MNDQNRLGNLNKIVESNQLNKDIKSNNLPKTRQYQNIKNTQNLQSNNTLPKVRQYNNIQKETVVISNAQDLTKLLNNINKEQIEQFESNDPIAQKEKKIIADNIELMDLLTNINKEQALNNITETTQNITNEQPGDTQLNLNTQENTQENIQSDNQNNNQFKYAISNEQLLNKAQYIAQTIQLQIYSNPQYNYYKLIQFVHNLYEQYGDNPMTLMIICKGISQFNKKQFVKLPEDKIGDIIQYIITQIKK